MLSKFWLPDNNMESLLNPASKSSSPLAVSAVSLLKNDAPCIPSTVSASNPEPEPSFDEFQTSVEPAAIYPVGDPVLPLFVSYGIIVPSDMCAIAVISENCPEFIHISVADIYLPYSCDYLVTSICMVIVN